MESTFDSTPARLHYLSGSPLLSIETATSRFAIPTSYLIALLASPSSTRPGAYSLIRTLAPHHPNLITRTTITNPPADLLTRFLLPSDPPAHLRNPITVIISPSSGVGSAESYYADTLSQILAIYSLQYTRVITTSATSIASIAADLPTATPHTLILLSGDTLIFELLNALPQACRPTIVVIPTGTGNALSSSLHKTSNALHALLLGSSHPLPGFIASFSEGSTLSGYSIPGGSLKGSVVTSWGFHASIVGDSDALDMRSVGVDKFQVAARANLTTMHGYRGTLWVRRGGKWEVVEDREQQGHFYVVVTGLSNFERDFVVSPAARGVAGGLRIVYFGVADVGGKAEEVMEIMRLAYAGGQHVDCGKVRYEAVEGVRIEMAETEEKWRRVCVDGALVHVEEGGWVEVIRNEGWMDVVYRE